jgi:spore maturation protein CgeB
MRVFYAVGSRPNSALETSSVWRRNLYEALVRLGHDVVEFDFDLEPYYRHANPAAPGSSSFISAHRPVLEFALLEQLARAHSREPIDVFFSYFYSAFARPEAIWEIAQMGIATVNWYCNASYQFHLVSDIAPAYDFCLVPERFRLEDYRAVGANPIYCQEAANPDFYRPCERTNEYDVTFVGACYGERPEYVRYLLDRGIDIHVFGPGWADLIPPAFPARIRRVLGQVRRRVTRRPMRPPLLPARCCSGGTLSDQEMVRMYSRSKMSIGFSVVGDTHREPVPIRQVRLRDFEAPMSGACYLVEYMPEIEEFFIPGKEILCYSSKHELLNLVRYYLAHPQEAEQIGRAGYERALRDHTWQNRLHYAFREMGLGA